MSELEDKAGAGTHDIQVELGFTKSMGKDTYEFLRVDIRHGLRLGNDDDLDTVLDNINQLTNKIYENLEVKIVEKVDELDLALGPRGRHSKIHSNKGSK